jgi:hypothetical protein
MTSLLKVKTNVPAVLMVKAYRTVTVYLNPVLNVALIIGES